LLAGNSVPRRLDRCAGDCVEVRSEIETLGTLQESG